MVCEDGDDRVVVTVEAMIDRIALASIERFHFVANVDVELVTSSVDAAIASRRSAGLAVASTGAIPK